MAKCNNCGKATSFGHNRSHSLVATRRMFRPNLQKVTIVKDGQKESQVLCARCIKTLTKSYK